MREAGRDIRVSGATMLAAMLAMTSVFAHDHDGTPHEQPIWTWTPDQIVAHIDTVRAGADLTPKGWPGGNKVAVTFSFDVDKDSGVVSRRKTVSRMLLIGIGVRGGWGFLSIVTR